MLSTGSTRRSGSAGALTLTALLAAALALAPARSTAAATLHPIGNFEQPTYITSEPDDPNRLLITERLGQIVLDDHGKVSTFADLSSLVGCGGGCTGERGLMSLAVAPDYATSGHLYVDYINNSTGEIHVDELTAVGDSAQLSTLRPLLTIAHPDASNHNGGQLQFGPDGHLYISTGDGGGSNDEFHNSQSLSSPLGKLLRIDPSETSPAPTVWSYGLRNPFRFSFDSLNGNLVIGDVGQGAREEVDFAPRLPGGEVGGNGVNYGWNCREGFIEGPATDLPGEGCATGSFAKPVFDYPHSDPGEGKAHGCAIIGGYVVRDPSLGDLYGRYLYGDLCVGELRSLVLPATGTGMATGDRSEGVTIENLNSFGEDSCHRVYAVSGSGEIARLEGSTPAGCTEEEPPKEEPRGKGPTNEVGPGNPHNKTRVVLGAAQRAVRAGTHARLTVSVAPCAGRDGQRVILNRGGRLFGSAPLAADCTASFRPRVSHTSTFRVVVPTTEEYTIGRSKRLTIATR